MTSNDPNLAVTARNGSRLVLLLQVLQRGERNRPGNRVRSLLVLLAMYTDVDTCGAGVLGAKLETGQLVALALTVRLGETGITD